MTLFIYSSKTTHRLKYTFDLIFDDLLGIRYTLIDDEEEFKRLRGAKMSYAEEPVSDEVFFYAVPLLFQKKLKQQEITISEFEGEKTLFPVSSSQSALPFDPFAAAFYLVSRYEEYLPFISDRYGRFPAEESLAYEHDFLNKPLVNLWALKIKDILMKKYPELPFPKKNYSFVPTYDIDAAFSYKSKGLVRSFGGYILDLKNLNFKDILQRSRVLLGLQKDPFDNFDRITKLHKRFNLNAIFFFLVGNYDEFDKNISIHVQKFQSLIKSIADYSEVGIHPSYASNYEPKKLEKEINRLAAVVKREVTKSRQHLIKLKLPSTYRNLIDLDISDDYSMGYPDKIGFRASIASPFHFYNLDQEIKTSLKVHPFAAMDATFKYHSKAKNDDIIRQTQRLINEVKKVNGEFVFITHNSSFSEEKEWKGWANTYEKIVKAALPENKKDLDPISATK